MKWLVATWLVAGWTLLALGRDDARTDETHWAFARPERCPPPVVERESWPRNDVDRFILARLEAEGLEPSPAASRATWIRRVSLDLTGLPPSVEEVEAFAADVSADAYGRVVERLLASPHFGERMAVHWLDLARYADTNGYLDDERREMWKWRDWVIQAFNDNMPFDQFTVEQIAGDMLPEATLAQRVATGFNRNHPVTNEGNGQPGEYAHHYVADRVRTTSVAWMGLTMGCAECHDHKYDPLSQRDYYRFYAFFNNVPEKGLVDERNPPPFLRLPNEEQGARLAEQQAAVEELRTQRNRYAAEAELGQMRWQDELRQSPVMRDFEQALVARVPLDREVPGEAELRGIGHTEWIDGVRGRALQLDGRDSFIDAGAIGSFNASDAFTVGAWVRFEGDETDRGGALVAKVDETRSFRGYSLAIDSEYLSFQLRASFVDDDDIQVESRDPLERDRWYHVAASYDGSRTVGGLRLYVNGEPAALYEPRDSDEPEPLKDDIDHGENLRIGCSDGDPFKGSIDDVRIYGRVLSPAEMRNLVRADLAELVTSDGPLTPDQRCLLRDYYQAHVSPHTGPILAQIAALQAERTELLQDVPLVSVMAELDERRPTHLLRRGDYSKPGPVVEPGIPDVLPQLLEEAPADRLALAKWLVHPDHPLVGRVAVNRIWAQLFGTGLVATLDDFGTQGELPSHPALLDFLTREFVDGGWDVKQLVRTIVTSATYRQDSRVDSERLSRDPANRLLGRAARRVLDAELVRDNALAVGGILDARLHGPPTRPWQPAGVWLAGAGLPDEDYEPSPVADRYRRGVYVFWKREAPYASFKLFDAPTREVCTVRRTRTNTPLQALALLNDRVYVEAARGLAQRVLKLEGTDGLRLERAFRLCVAREPRPAELALLTALLDEQRGEYADKPEAAAALIRVGDIPRAEDVPDAELAAWIAVSSVLLNLDETITRG